MIAFTILLAQGTNGSGLFLCNVLWEEQSWLRSKSIHAAEFLHGTLEIVDETTPVTLFIGEDEQRPLAERVAKLLPKICANYTIIDSKAYELPGISEKYRGRVISFL